MKSKDAVSALTALAQESRLAVFRLLVQAGEEGMAASKIAERLDLPASSLSFHLKELMHAGMVNQEKDGRSLIYSANYKTMDGLLDFLMQNCCGGAPCASAQKGKRS